MKSIGLVLSGGGARGAAHLGVLKALRELNVKISAISGVSAGAVIGALFAAGIPVEKILEVLKEQSYFGLKDFSFGKKGFFSMINLRRMLEQLIGYDDFSRLPIPLFVNATDVSTGTAIHFSEGRLYDAVLGSATVPIVYEPMAYDNYLLLDGGILNNLPVEPLLGKCDFIIGSHANKLYDGHFTILDKISIIDQCFHLAIAEGVKERSKSCDIFIEPLLEGFGMFEMKSIDKIYDIGYKAAMEHKGKLLASALV